MAAIQGAIKVELARDQAERALELAREASAIDSLGRTAGVLAYLEAEVGAQETPAEAVARGATMIFMEAQEAPPTREEAEALLAATLADLRRGARRPGRRRRVRWLRWPHRPGPRPPTGAAVPPARRSSTTSASSATCTYARSATTTSAAAARPRQPAPGRGSFEELGDLEPIDALSFADSKPYPDRIAAAQKKTGAKSGGMFGTGTIDGNQLVVAGIDFDFIGGSMGGAVGEAITRGAELALENACRCS